MKKIVSTLLLCCFSLGCSGPKVNLDTPSNRWTEFQQQCHNNLVNIEILSDEQTGLIKKNTANYEMLMLNISKAAFIRADQENQCRLVYRSDLYLPCLGYLRSLREYSAEMEIATAKYFAQSGKKEEAKEMYRNVITNYVGSSYRSYVKQAELGLEDLKKK
jgi:hypothetical protein